MWGIEQSNGSVEWKSLPILENGKYKYYYNSGQEGPYGLGFIPVKRYNQNLDDYDFSVNVEGEVIQNNIATLKITDGVLDSILTMEGGTLNLPSSLPALNQATEFNTNGKNYATGVSIDLSELTYYPTMPMPQFNNGTGSNIIDITENNSITTFEELDGNRKNIEYITTPENPTPTPLMRSIVVKKNNSETKGGTRDVTTSNIVGYVNVNIPPPNITNTIQNNGYYKFNSNWNGLIEGTEQDHELDINVKASLPLLQNKTITIDSIENNGSYTVRPTSTAVNIMPIMTSNNYNNGEVILTGSGENNQAGNYYWNAFDGITTGNYHGFYTAGQYSWLQISFSTPKKFNYFNYFCTPLYPTSYGEQTYVLGSNDNQNFEYLYREESINPMVDNESSYNYLTTTGEFLYYRFEFHTTANRIYVAELQLMKTEEADGLNTVTIINNTDSKIYKGYNDNNKYSITQTGDGTITIPANYQALGEIKYNVNIPTTQIDNADVDSQNNNIITTRTGTYTIPSGKTGWNSFSVNVPSDVNNYNGYTSNSRLLISSSGTGVINIPSGYNGLGTIYYNVSVPQWSPIHFSKAQFFTKYNTSSSTTKTLSSTTSSNYTLNYKYCCLFVNKTTNAYIYVGNTSGNSSNITVTLPSGTWAYSEIILDTPYDSSNPVSCNILTNDNQTIISVQCIYHDTSFTATSQESLYVDKYKFSLN